MSQIFIGGNLTPRSEERRQDRPAPPPTQTLVKEPEPEGVGTSQVPRTFFEALDEVSHAGYAVFSGTRMRHPDEDLIHIFSWSHKRELTLPVSSLLDFLRASGRVKEIYQWSPHLSHGGWTGQLTPGGGELLANLLRLEVRIGDKVCHPDPPVL